MGVEYPHATVIKIRKFRFLSHENRPKWSQVVTNVSNNGFRVKLIASIDTSFQKTWVFSTHMPQLLNYRNFHFFQKIPTIKRGVAHISKTEGHRAPKP